MNRYISSFYDGRCRIRHTALKNANTVANIEGMLSNIDGVIAVTTNPRVGSLLLEYDVDVLPTQSLMDMVTPLAESFFASADNAETNESAHTDGAALYDKASEAATKYVAGAKAAGSKLLKQGQSLTDSVDGVLKKNVTRKTINYSMLASLGLSVGLSFTGSKNAHVITGGIFLAGLTMHLLRNRKAL